MNRATGIFVLLSLWWLIVFFCLYGQIPGPDLLNFWGAGAVLLRGGDPYDLPSVAHVLVDGGFIQHVPSPVFNPPPVLVALAPLAYLEPRIAYSVLALINVLGFGFGAWFFFTLLCPASRLNKLQSPIRDQICLTASLLSAFAVPLTLELGQIDGIVFAGLGAAFFLSTREGLLAPTLAGVALAMTAAKPHLFLLCYLVIFWREWRRARWILFVAFLASCALGACFAHALYPEVWTQWLKFRSSDPLHYMQPSIGTYLRVILNQPAAWGLNYLATGIGVLWFLLSVVAGRRFTDRDIASTVLPLSLLCAPYIWLYDFALLLPTLLVLTIFSPRLNGALVALLLGSAGFLGPREMHYYLWYPVLLFIAVHLMAREQSLR